MRSVAVLRASLSAVVAVFALSGCDSGLPTDVAPGDRSASVGNSEVHLLARGHAQSARSATRRIGAAGGTIALDGALLIVPAGALSSAVDITVTLPAGAAVQADLQPHGLQFARPVTLAFSLDGTNVRPGAASSVLTGVYFDGVTNGAVTARETFKVFQYGQSAAFQTTHFSMYGLFKGFILVGG
jgi:hypothetical protein